MKIAYLLSALLLAVSGSAAGEISGGPEKDEFDKLVRRLDYNPDDLLAGDKLRDLCRQQKSNDQCIDALNGLTEKHPHNKSLRYQAALAYVDEVPGHTLFRQGWLSTRSMDHMSEVIQGDPNDWTAYYIRGLNTLYWPRSFRKLPKGIEDLKYCISLSEKLPKGLLKPYYGYAYIALGDAYVKNEELDKGREVYKQGRQFFESPELDKRLGMTDEDLDSFIKKFRNADQRVDTEISFLVNGGADKL